MTGQPTLWALWRSFTRCKFVESVGDVVFFKDMRGESARAFADLISAEGAEGQKGDGASGETEGVLAGQDEKEDVMAD